MTMTEFLGALERGSRYVLFEFNQTPVTPASIVMFAVVIFGFFLFSRLINRLIFRKLFPRLQIDQGLQFTFVRITHYLIMIVGAVVAFQFVGSDLSGLAVIFGLLSVGIGFGLQNVVSNFVAGVILLFKRPIRVGDRVTVGGTEGDVMSINLRSTAVRSLNNITIIVPNSEFISSQVINWSHGDPRIRLEIDVGVSYSSDLDTVLDALQAVAKEDPDVLPDPQPEVILHSFGDSSWNMQLRAWIGEPSRHALIRSQLNCAIVRKFRERGIEIPFPQRDLHIRSPLPVPLSTDTGQAGPHSA